MRDLPNTRVPGGPPAQRALRRLKRPQGCVYIATKTGGRPSASGQKKAAFGHETRGAILSHTRSWTYTNALFPTIICYDLRMRATGHRITGQGGKRTDDGTTSRRTEKAVNIRTGLSRTATTEDHIEDATIDNTHSGRISRASWRVVLERTVAGRHGLCLSSSGARPAGADCPASVC